MTDAERLTLYEATIRKIQEAAAGYVHPERRVTAEQLIDVVLAAADDRQLAGIGKCDRQEEWMTEADSDDFFVALRPTRKGFRLHEGDDRILRLWVGKSSTGQEMGLLSYGMFCETQLHGFDYTPVDLASLPLFPADIGERIAAVNALVDEAKTDNMTGNW